MLEREALAEMAEQRPRQRRTHQQQARRVSEREPLAAVDALGWSSDRIPSAGAEWGAARNSARTHPTPLKDAVLHDRLFRV